MKNILTSIKKLQNLKILFEISTIFSYFRCLIDEKMKKALSHIAILALTLLTISCGVDNTNSYVTTKPQKQQVKTQTKWLVETNSEKLISIFSYKEYDITGKIIKYSEYSETGLLSSETSYSYIQNESRELKNFYNVSGSIDSIQNNLYTYDLKGNITKKIVFDKLGDTVVILNYDYDSKGNLIKKVEFNPKNLDRSETNYTNNYNPSGLIVERVINPGINGRYDLKEEFKYVVDASTIEKKSYDSTGKVQLIYSYIYNSDGKIIKEILSNNADVIIKKFQYVYTYFNSGNFEE